LIDSCKNFKKFMYWSNQIGHIRCSYSHKGLISGDSHADTILCRQSHTILTNYPQK
jgi:hypothetical protein